MMTIKVGVIGAGMWGKTHIKQLQDSGTAEVRWVCSQRESSTREVQQQFNIKHGTRDYSEILADPKVDAVVIATPPYLHAQMAIDAIEAGKHTLIEKPMVVNAAEIESILKTTAANPDIVVVEGSARHSRLQPKFGYICEFIRSGKLGDVYHVHHERAYQSTFIEYNPAGTWAMSKTTSGGGPMFDWGEYDLSFHLGILGDPPPPINIRAFATNELRDLSRTMAESNVEQHAVAMMEFEPNLTYYYERGSGLHMDIPSQTRIYGTKGGLKFSYLTWDSNKIEFFHGDEKPQVEVLEVPMDTHPEHDNVYLINHFLACIRGQAVPAMSSQLAAKHLRILMEITKQTRKVS